MAYELHGLEVQNVESRCAYRRHKAHLIEVVFANAELKHLVDRLLEKKHCVQWEVVSYCLLSGKTGNLHHYFVLS